MSTRRAGFASSMPGYGKFETKDDRKELARLWNSGLTRGLLRVRESTRPSTRSVSFNFRWLRGPQDRTSTRHPPVLARVNFDVVLLKSAGHSRTLWRIRKFHFDSKLGTQTARLVRSMKGDGQRPLGEKLSFSWFLRSNGKPSISQLDVKKATNTGFRYP